MFALAYVKHRDSNATRAEPGRAQSNPARAAFLSTLSIWMALYVLAVTDISWLFDIDAWPLWARIAAAIAPALPIGGAIYALLRYVKAEPDEYQRLLLTRAVLIATGEVFTRRQTFQPYITQRALDIIQPDLTKCGGLSEGRRMAWMAPVEPSVDPIRLS